MSILDEIRSGILENTEIDANEKICLVVLLCSGNVSDMEALAHLMGTTPVTAQMAVRSLRLKGYLKNENIGSDEAEISALKRLLEKEGSKFESRLIKAPRANVGSASADVGALPDDVKSSRADFEAEPFKEFAAEPLQNTYRSRVAALYKKDGRGASVGASGSSSVGVLGSSSAGVLGGVSGDVSVGVSGGSLQGGLDIASLGVNPKAAKTEQSAVDSKSPEDRVMEIIDEAITRSEAAIILGFARGDVDKVEKMYKRVRGTQIKDKIDALVKLLQ